MKKLLLISTILICSTVFAQDFYVSIDGSDAATGSKDKPVATLNKAIERAKKLVELRGYPNEGITIYIAEGVYQSDEAISLDAILSGTEQAPLTIKPIDGAKVQIIGGRKFSLSDFSKVTDPDVLKRMYPEAAKVAVMLDLKTHGIKEYGQLPLYGHSMGVMQSKTRYKQGENAPELFFNAQPLTLARWPNEGFATIGRVVDKGDIVRDWLDDRKGQDAYVPLEKRNDPPRGFSFQFDGEELKRWTNARDMRMYGYWFCNWSDQSVEVASVDVNAGVIHSVQPSCYGVKSGQRFYVYNLLEEMDEPGEWYLDRDSGILYLIPPQDDPKSLINLSMMTNPLLDIEGASNIIIEGIDMGFVRGGAVKIQDGTNVSLVNCRVGNTGGLGVQIYGGSNHSLKDCKIFNTGSGGVTVFGGVIKSLTPSNHVIENCLIHNYARIEKTYKPAINLSGVGNRASHNEIHDGAHMAIGFSGNNHIIELNHIYDVARETDDMAAIYSGRSWVSRGTVIRYNLIRDVTGFKAGTHKVSGVYLDDGISGITVEGNIFLNVAQGLMFNGGRDNTAVNNVFIDVENMARSTSLKEAFKTWAASSLVTLKQGIKACPIDKEPWLSAYPHLATMLNDEPELPKYTTIKDNLRFNAPIIIGDKGIHDVVVEFGKVENNIEVAAVPGSYDPHSGHFEFNPDSGVFDLMPDLRNIQTDKIGIIK